MITRDLGHGDDEQRYRRQSRSSFHTALTMFGLAGILAFLGRLGIAVGFAAIGVAALAWAATYLIMYRA